MHDIYIYINIYIYMYNIYNIYMYNIYIYIYMLHAYITMYIFICIFIYMYTYMYIHVIYTHICWLKLRFILHVLRHAMARCHPFFIFSRMIIPHARHFLHIHQQYTNKQINLQRETHKEKERGTTSRDIASRL